MINFINKHFQFRKITAILLLAVFILLTSNSYALDGSSFNADANQAESGSSFTKGLTYAVAPLTGMAAGGVLCGPWCIVIGGAIGAIDEILNRYGYSDRHYLTWIIVGAAVGNTISPSKAFVGVGDKGGLVTREVLADLSDVIKSYSATGIGAIVGILLPSGKLHQYPELAAPIISAIAGYGTIGLIQGLATNIIDEILISGSYSFDELLIANGYTNNHGMSGSIVGLSLANSLVNLLPAIVNILPINVNFIDKAVTDYKPILSNFIGLILSFAIVSYEDEAIESFQAPIRTTKNLYETYNKFLPKKYLDSHIEKHALGAMGTHLFVQFVAIKIGDYHRSMYGDYMTLNADSSKALSGVKSKVQKVIIFIFPYIIGEAFSNVVDSYFRKDLQSNLEDKITSELFSGENALRLSYNNNSTVLIDSLNSDVKNLIHSGGNLLTSAISSSIKGAYGLGVVMVSSPTIFIYSFIYNKAGNLLAKTLVDKNMEYADEVNRLNSEFTTIIKHDGQNIRTITERDGIEVTKENIQRITEELRKNEKMQFLLGKANSVSSMIFGWTDFALGYYFIANEIDQSRISFDVGIKIPSANWRLSNLLSWSKDNAERVARIDKSLNRIISLEELIHQDSSNLDKINREYDEGDRLIVQDLEIGFDDKTLVTIDDLELDMGKVYAITGKTGCGKSSFLSKIKGIKENGVFGSGNIYYPAINSQHPKIVMFSQQDYFPKNTSLQDIIYYPNKAPNDTALNLQKDEEALLLLKEIGMCGFTEYCKRGGKSLTLDSKEDWYKYLSGGEKKKISIVSAIIKKPDILILDEIFNGLDAESIAVAQKMLKKYLPDSLILVVDHHATDNNGDGFYDGGQLHFADQKIHKIQ